MPSLKRIAADLGVSYTLVSKVLSGRLGTTGVSPATRDAIIKHAKALEYTPNRLAVALKAGRKGAVGIFLHRIGSPGSDVTDRLLRGLAEGLEESGARMWLRFFTTDEEFMSACDSQITREVDGLIVAGMHHPGLMPRFRELERQKFPVVSIVSDLPAGALKSLTNIAVNYESQGYLATKHLLEQGCRRLACLDTVANRTAGFVKAHKEAKIKVQPELVIQAQRFFVEDGREKLLELRELGVPFDGIVCQSDAQAVGAINEAVRLGIDVPGTLKITGVDNSPAAANCIVPITSVTSQMRKAALKAVEIILDRIEGKPRASEMIEPSLYIRRSSGGPLSHQVDEGDLE